MTSSESRNHQSVRTKLFYGVGEMGEGLKTAALETFLFFYFVQVVGLSGTLTGIGLFTAMLIDGAADPFVGAWSDRTRTRIGRRHPFLYAAPVPLAVALYFLFSPPADLPQVGLFLWLVGFAVTARIAMAFYFVPHMALGAELSQDFRERVAIGGYRQFFGYLGRMVALAGAFILFFQATPEFKNGQLNPAVYPPFALYCGGLVILFVITSALGTQKAVMALPPTPQAPADLRRGVLPTLWAALSSRSFRALFIALLVMSIFTGTQQTLALHMNTYFWELAPQQIQFTFYASMIGFMLGVPIVPGIAQRFDKKPVYIACIGLSCAVISTPAMLRLAGLMPPNGDPTLIWILCGTNLLYGIVGSAPGILAAAMLADLSDEYEHNHGKRTEGLFFGVNAFCRKASLGAGGAVAGVLIDIIRFPAKAAPGSVAPDILYRLGVVYGPVLLAVLILGLLTLIPYDLDRRRHAALVHMLQGRREPADG